jgi:hypothetical protein
VLSSPASQHDVARARRLSPSPPPSSPPSIGCSDAASFTADLGADHFERTERTRLAARLTRKLAELGFQVTLADRPVA